MQHRFLFSEIKYYKEQEKEVVIFVAALVKYEYVG